MVLSIVFVSTLLLEPRVAISQTSVPYSTKAETVPLSDYVRKVFQDASGHYWFGTNNDGVARFDGQSLRFLTPEDGLAGSAIRGILQDRNGSMWFATDGGVSRYRDGEFRNYTTAHGLTHNDIWSLYLDATGGVWVGTREGLCRLVDDTFVPFDLPVSEIKEPRSRFSPKLVWSMLADKAGNLWFGTDGSGVYRFDGNEVVAFTEKDGLAGHQVSCMVQDQHGVIWFGFGEGGVTCFDGVRFQSYGKQDGMPEGWVWTMDATKKEGLLISILGEGVHRFDGRSFARFARDLPSHVQSLFYDKDGMLWFGCSGGLFREGAAGIVHVSRSGPWRDDRSIDVDSTIHLQHFSRLIANTWKTTAKSGRSMLHSWRWGPGKRSVEHWTKGENAAGEPWQQLIVYYWDPKEEKIRFLGISPYESGISRGVFSFDGTDASTDVELTQTGGRRQMQVRWHFSDSDHYRETLLERNAAGELFELVEFNYVKTDESLDKGLEAFDGMFKLTPEFDELEFLIGQRWIAKTDKSEMRASIGWVPFANFLYGRIYRGQDSEQPATSEVTRQPLSDELWGNVYIYNDVHLKSKRFLVLAEDGSIYEGDIKKRGESWSVAFSSESAMSHGLKRAQVQSLKDQRWSIDLQDDRIAAEANRAMEVIFERDQ